MPLIYRLLLALLCSFVFQPANAQEQVRVGVYVNDVPQFDLTTNSFTIDAVIWFRWSDPDYDPATTMEFMNPFQGWDGARTPTFEQPEQLDDGSYYQTVRYQGQFASRMPLTLYPFDSQTLQVVMEDVHANVDEQIYVPDAEPVVISPSLGLSDYVIKGARLDVAEQTYATGFGDTSLKGLETYSRATLSIPLHRPSVTYGIKVLFPILVILACAALALWLHPGHSEARVGLVVTSLLTLVAFQLTSLPQVNYIIMMDWMFFLSYLYVLGTLVQVVRSHWIIRSRDEDMAVGIDRQFFWAISAGFIAMSVLVLVLSARA